MEIPLTPIIVQRIERRRSRLGFTYEKIAERAKEKDPSSTLCSKTLRRIAALSVLHVQELTLIRIADALGFELKELIADDVSADSVMANEKHPLHQYVNDIRDLLVGNTLDKKLYFLGREQNFLDAVYGHCAAYRAGDSSKWADACRLLARDGILMAFPGNQFRIAPASEHAQVGMIKNRTVMELRFVRTAYTFRFGSLEHKTICHQVDQALKRANQIKQECHPADYPRLADALVHAAYALDPHERNQFLAAHCHSQESYFQADWIVSRNHHDSQAKLRFPDPDLPKLIDDMHNELVEMFKNYSKETSYTDNHPERGGYLRHKHLLRIHVRKSITMAKKNHKYQKMSRPYLPPTQNQPMKSRQFLGSNI